MSAYQCSSIKPKTYATGRFKRRTGTVLGEAKLIMQRMCWESAGSCPPPHAALKGRGGSGVFWVKFPGGRRTVGTSGRSGDHGDYSQFSYTGTDILYIGSLDLYIMHRRNSERNFPFLFIGHSRVFYMIDLCVL